MKTKLVYMFAAAMAVSAIGFAQNADDKKIVEKKGTSYISLGPIGGFGHSWTSNMNNRFKPSAHLGIAMIYSRFEHWGWGTELTASHEGYSTAIGNQTFTYDPTYLRMTPKAYYFFGNYGDNIRPKIYLGPSVAYKVAEDRYVGGPNNSDIRYTDRGSYMINDWDLGVDVGAGVNIKVAPYTWLNLDADYYHGLLDVTRMNGMNNMNRSLRANVGVMMGI
ncbi:MAG: PorT family protein [Taibaiella sp.]|nr:PorT family protein [Taibaiella sp.]